MKLHKLVSIVMCFILMTGFFCSAYAADDAEVIRISGLDAFLEFAENCRLDSYSKDKHFLLTTDIDLTGTDFDGIPIFCGTFDGGYHTITGLNVDASGSDKGLFRQLSSTAVVKCLNVEGKVTPSGTRSNVGGIAGVNSGLIEDCSFKGDVIGADSVGGIAGVNTASGLIVGCKTSGSVSAAHFSGGVAGTNAGSIRNCSNQSNVNVTAQQNQIDISDINLGTLTNSESAAATTDIGGIAGYNSGVILLCKNRGDVGYKHMGYNVGGIAGRQAGYVADCENYGAVSGRKEVGGIAGQQEPYILLSYQTDTLQILRTQFSVLSEMISRLSANTNENTAAIKNLLYRLESYIADAEGAISYLETSLENPKFEDVEKYLDALNTISNSLEGISDTLRSLRDALDQTTTDFEKDMKEVSEQLALIEQTLNNAEDNLGGKVFDVSDLDTAEDLTSKTENCVNYGTVLGDLNAGGILGAIVFENDLDPEEDITVSGDMTLNAVGNIRSVVRNCCNHGTVTAKTQRIGGIVGWLSIGLVKDCINSASIENPSSEYVGGIVGDSNGYIRDCLVKATVSGEAFVGGIAGRGAVVSDCYAMVMLSGTENIGAILGGTVTPYSETENPISGNFYLHVGVDYGGIDGISYWGMAQGLSLDAFLENRSHPMFCEVTITFIANGQIIYQVTQNTGSAFSAIPDVPVMEGYSGFWTGISDVDMENILFDVTIEATYVAYSTVIQSEETDGNQKPILLLQGDFSMGATASVTAADGFSALQDHQTLIQAWNLSIAECKSLHTGRLLIPADTDMQNVILLVRDSTGNWTERTYRTDGSYIVFSLEQGNDGIALVQQPAKTIFTTEVLVAAGIGAVTVSLIFIICILVRRRNRNKREQAMIEVKN